MKPKIIFSHKSYADLLEKVENLTVDGKHNTVHFLVTIINKLSNLLISSPKSETLYKKIDGTQIHEQKIFGLVFYYDIDKENQAIYVHFIRFPDAS